MGLGLGLVLRLQCKCSVSARVHVMTWESFVDARRSYCLSVKCRVRAIFDTHPLRP